MSLPAQARLCRLAGVPAPPPGKVWAPGASACMTQVLCEQGACIAYVKVSTGGSGEIYIEGMNEVLQCLHLTTCVSDPHMFDWCLFDIIILIEVYQVNLITPVSWCLCM